MSKLVFDMSMSVDGYVTAANQTAEEPLGEGGQQLHDWINPDDATGLEVLSNGVAGTGAVICGRRTYDDSQPWWGPDGPTGDARRPLFVLTHTPPADPPADSVYTFVTGGIEDALAQAREAAGDKNVTVMGGPAVGNQYLRAGLIDELSIHRARRTCAIASSDGREPRHVVREEHARDELAARAHAGLVEDRLQVVLDGP